MTAPTLHAYDWYTVIGRGQMASIPVGTHVTVGDEVRFDHEPDQLYRVTHIEISRVLIDPPVTKGLYVAVKPVTVREWVGKR